MEREEKISNKAWDFLDKKGLTLRDKIMVRAAFVEWGGYKDENPFIERTYTKMKTEYYHSTHDLIKHFMFKTKNEVVLANAIYLNMKKGSNNEFIEMFKYTCRIIGLNSEWT